MSFTPVRIVLCITIVLALPAAAPAVPPQRPEPSQIAAVAFSPDGRILATGSTSGAIQLWDTLTGTEVAKLSDLQTIVCVAFSPDGKTLASGTWDAGVTLWDVAAAEAQTVLSGHTDVVEGVAFSPDGKTLATASWDGTVRLWDVRSGQQTRYLEGDGTQRSVAFSPDGTLIAIGTSDGLRVLAVATGRELFALTGTNDIRSVDFAPDGQTLLMAHHASQECTLQVLDAATGRAVYAVNGHGLRARCARFSPDGQRFASAGEGGAVKLWDAATGRLVMTFEGHTADSRAVDFSAGGTILASGSADGTAKLWDVATGQELATLDGRSEPSLSPESIGLWRLGTGPDRATLLDLGSMAGVAVSPDGATLATGSWDGTAHLWEAATGRQLAALKGHTDIVWGVAFSPDGWRLATASWDGTAGLWEAATARPLLTLQTPDSRSRTYCAVFSPDGATLATGSGDTARLWDAVTGELRGELDLANDVYGVAWSSDGAMLATAGERSEGRCVVLWDIAARRPLFAADAHGDEAYSVCFSPDGKRLASTGQDATVRIWDVATGEELAHFASNAANILARIGPSARAALPVLLDVLTDEHLGVRRTGLEDLWPSRPDHRVTADRLIEGIRHEQSLVRSAAARALAQLGPAAAAAIPALREATQDKARVVREAAATALEQIDPDATEGSGP